MRTFKQIWEQYLIKGDNFGEYFSASIEHKGWRYSYLGMDVVCIKENKEEAFNLAMDCFIDFFGKYNVVEDKVSFNPIFDSPRSLCLD